MAEEKDQNNKIGILDVLVDQPQLIRKLPIGPTIEELQDSKMDQLLEGKSRPASHNLKDILSVIIGTAIQEGGSALGSKLIRGAKAAKASSKVVQNALETAADSIDETAAAITKAEGRTKAGKMVDTLSDTQRKIRGAKDVKANADSNISDLTRKIVDKEEEITFLDDLAEGKKNRYIKDRKNFEGLEKVDLPENISDRDVYDSLSDVQKSYNEKRMQVKLRENELSDAIKAVKTADDELAALKSSLKNYPTAEESDKIIGELTSTLEGQKSYIYDVINGMSDADLAKKYGTETIEYVPNTWNKNAKSAGKKTYKLGSKYKNPFVDFVLDMEKTPEGKVLASNLIDGQTDDFNKFLKEYSADVFEQVKQGKDIKEAASDMLKRWDIFRKASIAKEKKSVAQATLDSLSEGIAKLEKTYGDDLYKVTVDKGKYILGNDKFGLKLKEEPARKMILDKLNKEKSYLKTFEKLVNPSDPIQKAFAKADGSDLKKLGLAKRIDKGMNIVEAIQDLALEETIDHYDADYIKYFDDVLNSDLPSGVIPKPNFKNSIIRNEDGTLKSASALADTLSKDPFYISTINNIVKEITGDAKPFIKAGMVETAAIPLLGNWIKNATKVGNAYDPFGKELDFELPPEMIPWDPKLERGFVNNLINNTLDVAGINFNRDANRFSTKQINAMREALEYANNIKHWKLPEQVEGWSDDEIIDRAIEIGKGQHSKIAPLVIQKYKELMGKETK